MSAESLSMEEWLSHAAPNMPLRLLRDEARALREEAKEFAEAVEFFSDLYFADTNDRHQYAADEDWDHLYAEDEALD